jgi:hypothetical protein
VFGYRWSVRGLTGAMLAIGLLVAACSSGGSGGLPGASGGGNNGGNGGNGGNGATSLGQGLSANLDTLTSYKFTETMGGSSSGVGVSPGDSGSFQITGTVVNTPTKSISVQEFGVSFITVGDQSWTSYDGNTWMQTDSGISSLSDLLPTDLYGTWFDDNSSGFTVAGEENKNGVDCIHYKGNSSLSAGLSAFGVSANFQADLWVAKDGNYPVSGVYGFFGSSGGQSASYGYSFDITNVNDPSNTVTAPTNVVALPS